MNYRHAFHAGNIADVFKHVVLSRILVHLAKKEAPFCVIDTHAGAGFYRIDGEEASRSGEWRDGVGRLLEARLDRSLDHLLSPWRSLAASLMAGEPRLYPGSPALSQTLSRPQDRLVLCEMHSEEASELRKAFRGDRRITILAGDGWTLLQAHLPPRERRGMVLIDPPFEAEREFAAILAALAKALRRWASGIYAVWYPIKGRREVDSFARKLAALPARTILRAEIGLFRVERVDRLNGCGMIILNPPWRLDDELAQIAPAFVQIMARDSPGTSRLEWLKVE
jgi:23S rRNA (adenine2030-N6)-methyltransferase